MVAPLKTASAVQEVWAVCSWVNLRAKSPQPPGAGGRETGGTVGLPQLAVRCCVPEPAGVEIFGGKAAPVLSVWRLVPRTAVIPEQRDDFAEEEEVQSFGYKRFGAITGVLGSPRRCGCEELSVWGTVQGGPRTEDLGGSQSRKKQGDGFLRAWAGQPPSCFTSANRGCLQTSPSRVAPFPSLACLKAVTGSGNATGLGARWALGQGPAQEELQKWSRAGRPQQLQVGGPVTVSSFLGCTGTGTGQASSGADVCSGALYRALDRSFLTAA
ncbi:hypothetical protein H920_11516 [Fukomys damarensis]|uniref:Uncharacterized protein n=1 Tax=Fukomys damarensis TaxID=885580 RepID=A0A091DWD1_FUKDA|nr:hypothetical protein H920_11516 [Fukomys damarensis]